MLEILFTSSLDSLEQQIYLDVAANTTLKKLLDLKILEVQNNILTIPTNISENEFKQKYLAEIALLRFLQEFKNFNTTVLSLYLTTHSTTNTQTE